MLKFKMPKKTPRLLGRGPMRNFPRRERRSAETASRHDDEQQYGESWRRDPVSTVIAWAPPRFIASRLAPLTQTTCLSVIAPHVAEGEFSNRSLGGSRYRAAQLGADCAKSEWTTRARSLPSKTRPKIPGLRGASTSPRPSRAPRAP